VIYNGLLTLQVHLEPDALRAGVLFNNILELLLIFPVPSLSSKILLKEIGELFLDLPPELKVLHGDANNLK